MSKPKMVYRTGRLAASMTCILVAVAPVSAKSKADVTAISGTATGHVQKVGFRAMVQKQAIHITSPARPKIILTDRFDFAFKVTMTGSTRPLRLSVRVPKSHPT
jgi:hypothetical protein